MEETVKQNITSIFKLDRDEGAQNDV
jgi:hypothetical protein